MIIEYKAPRHIGWVMQEYGEWAFLFLDRTFKMTGEAFLSFLDIVLDIVEERFDSFQYGLSHMDPDEQVAVFSAALAFVAHALQADFLAFPDARRDFDDQFLGAFCVQICVGASLLRQFRGDVDEVVDVGAVGGKFDAGEFFQHVLADFAQGSGFLQFGGFVFCSFFCRKGR